MLKVMMPQLFYGQPAHLLTYESIDMSGVWGNSDDIMS